MKMSIADQIIFIEALRGEYMTQMLLPKLSDAESTAAARVAGKLRIVLETLRSVERLGTVEDLIAEVHARPSVPFIRELDFEDDDENLS